METYEILNRVGASTFIKYYYTFKGLDTKKAIAAYTEDYTLKSKRSRTSKVHKLFKENRHIEALKII
ncbi:MAG: hypothetical protein FWE68_05950, partial [Defluviitaleaceae bacterium]|nr:hypothetical protein [Defluviitaleaceae bacterium]